MIFCLKNLLFPTLLRVLSFITRIIKAAVRPGSKTAILEFSQNTTVIILVDHCFENHKRGTTRNIESFASSLSEFSKYGNRLSMILKNFGTYHIRVGATGVIGAANEKHIAMERQNEERWSLFTIINYVDISLMKIKIIPTVRNLYLNV